MDERIWIKPQHMCTDGEYLVRDKHGAESVHTFAGRNTRLGKSVIHVLHPQWFECEFTLLRE